MLMKSAPLYAQLFLRGTVAAFRTSGIEEASVEDIIEHTEAIAHVDGHRKPLFYELLPIANWLDTTGLILTDNLIHGIHAKVRLNVSPEDVLFALNREK